MSRRVAVLTRHLTASRDAALHEESTWTEVAVDFSSGMFRPVLSEAHDLQCAVEGQLPPCLLGGMYLRNGPNPHYAPESGVDPFHYFDGDGMVASFTICEDGLVSFSHKWVRTERFEQDEQAGGSSYEFGSMAVGTPVYKGVYNDEGERMGKANTSLVCHGGRMYAFEDASLPYRLALPSLRTLGKDRFGGTWEGSVFTAHPKIDPATRELVGYGCNYVPHAPAVWDYGVVSPDSGEVVTAFPITLRQVS